MKQLEILMTERMWDSLEAMARKQNIPIRGFAYHLLAEAVRKAEAGCAEELQRYPRENE